MKYLTKKRIDWITTAFHYMKLRKNAFREDFLLMQVLRFKKNVFSSYASRFLSLWERQGKTGYEYMLWNAEEVFW